MDMKKYLATQQASSCSNADSVLELLYNTYYEHVCTDDADEIKQGFDDLYNPLHDKTLKEKDVIIDLVCNLCRLHQQSGFIDGIRVGIKLQNEIGI
ncbi:MAG: hypothetical protein IKC86_07450 [Prevotella sp.]|nr:hypothetical protein [Prevotella sp.]